MINLLPVVTTIRRSVNLPASYCIPGIVDEEDITEVLSWDSDLFPAGSYVSTGAGSGVGFLEQDERIQIIRANEMRDLHLMESIFI